MKIKLSLLSLLFFTVHIIWAQDFRYGRVSKEELQEKQHPTDPTADAAILYREITSVFHYDPTAQSFYMVSEVFERIKIYTKEGFEWGTKEVSLFSSGIRKDVFSRLRAVTYTLDDNGKIQEERLRKSGIFDVDHNEYVSQTKFTMPNLKEGAVIEYRYFIRSPFIENIDEFVFQEVIPVNKVEVKFSHPDWFTFQTHQKGWTPFSIETDATTSSLAFSQNVDDTRAPGLRGGERGPRTQTHNVSFKEIINTVNMENVPALKLEAYAGNIRNYSSGLKFELSHTQLPGGMMHTYTTT